MKFMDGMPAEGMPVAERPDIRGYGVARDVEGLLPWSWAVKRLEASPTYWISTASLDGRPHSTPVWGAWIANALYFEGGPATRRGRNLKANPIASVGIEQGEDIVIVEGAVDTCEPGPELTRQLVEAFSTKYGPRFGYQPDPDNWRDGGLYRVNPRTVFGWGNFPADATRWTF